MLFHRADNSDFKKWVLQLKNDIRSTQIKAAVKVNAEMLRLYWRMGSDICEKQKFASWGDGWLKELSRELMAEFPEMKGFSHRNLKYIKQWYSFYNKCVIFGQQAVAQIDEEIFFSVPWGHQSTSYHNLCLKTYKVNCQRLRISKRA